jgi:hypothetical protein
VHVTRLVTRTSILAVVCALLATDAEAASRRVPVEFPTIGAAIAASASNDTILIDPGLYLEHLVTGDKFLTFIGAGAAQTILDGSNSGRVLSLGRGGRLHRVTVQRGRHATEGGGVLISRGTASTNSAIAVFEECDFIGNQATTYDGSIGGALAIRGYIGSTIVRGCRFLGNASYYQGGAVYIDYPAQFEDCEFRDSYGGLFGGAVFSLGASFRRCLFIGNRAEIAGGALYGAVDRFERNTLVGNRATGALVSAGGQVHLQYGFITGTVFANNIVVSGSGSGVYYGSDAPAQFRCNDVWDNTGPNYQYRYPAVVTATDNVSVDPQFCGADQGNYTLMSTSPCASQVAACGLVGAYDVGCSAIAVEPTTWSTIKRLVR